MVASLGYVSTWTHALAVTSAEPHKEELISEVSPLMRQLLKAFAKTIPDIPQAPRTELTAREHPTFWTCTDGAVVLTVDIHGRTSYRRKSGWNHQSFDHLEFSEARPDLPLAKDDPIIRGSFNKALSMARGILNSRSFNSAKGVVKQEIVVVANTADAKPIFALGRTLVRLMPDDVHFFQAIYSPRGDLDRVDFYLTPHLSSPVIDEVFKAKHIPTNLDQLDKFEGDDLTIGCFYSPKEDRAKLATHGWVGEEFLDVTKEHNPFVRDRLSANMPRRSDITDYPETDKNRCSKHDAAMAVWVEAYRKTDASRHWCWHWWDQYGRVGSFRGNSIPGKTDEWTMPNHRVVLIKSLGSYATVGDYPKKFWSEDFYNDLSRCTVATFNMHAGPVDGVLQSEGATFTWVRFFPEHNITDSSLRHLLFDACGTFTFLHPGKNEHPHLVETWIKGPFFEGLRTASGVDGPQGGVERLGWRFFGYYNKGDSISDSYAFAVHDEHIKLWPTTVAYSDSIKSALSSLSLGRFNTEKTERNAAAFSIWSSAYAFDRPRAALQLSDEFTGE